MAKKTKFMMWMGVLSLLVPGTARAQTNAVVKEVDVLSKTPEFTRAIERGVAAREVANSLGRTITGTSAAVRPFYTIPGNTPFTEIKRIELLNTPALPGREPIAKSIKPADSLTSLIQQLWARDLIGVKENEAIMAGSYNNMTAVERTLQETGTDPKFAFFGALAQGYLDLAKKIVTRYNVDVNSAIINDATTLELLPALQKYDKRVEWLLDNGLNPNSIITTGIYEKVCRATLTKAIFSKDFNPNLVMLSGAYLKINEHDVFTDLVARGLDPMAADENNYTALHWYAQEFLYELADKETFLTDWMARFPDANPNVQNVYGDTPLHVMNPFINKGGPYDAFYDQFHQLKGIDPLMHNKVGKVPDLDPERSHHWKDWLETFRVNIENLIVKYQYNDQALTYEQEIFIENKAAHFSLYPEELVAYLLPLGATPDDILRGAVIAGQKRYKKDWAEFIKMREVKDLVTCLTEEHGANRLTFPLKKEPVQP